MIAGAGHSGSSAGRAACKRLGEALGSNSWRNLRTPRSCAAGQVGASALIGSPQRSSSRTAHAGSDSGNWAHRKARTSTRPQQCGRKQRRAGQAAVPAVALLAGAQAPAETARVERLWALHPWDSSKSQGRLGCCGEKRVRGRERRIVKREPKHGARKRDMRRSPGMIVASGSDSAAPPPTGKRPSRSAVQHSESNLEVVARRRERRNRTRFGEYGSAGEPGQRSDSRLRAAWNQA